MLKYLEKILEVLFSHNAGVCIIAGLAFIFLGVFDVADFKSLTMRSPAARLPTALGLGLFIVGIFLHFRERRSKDFLKEFTAFYESCAADLSAPDLLFLAVAKYFAYEWTHGDQVARLKPEWRHDPDHWKTRSAFMERRGLMQRNSSDEFVRSDLGTAVVTLALKDGRFTDLANAMTSDSGLAHEWR